MNMIVKNLKQILFATISVLLFSSFASNPDHKGQHQPITRTSKIENGSHVMETIILFDKHTSSDNVIGVCTTLAKENVQLTFDKLTIGRGLFGLLGKNRIRTMEGKIELPNGQSQKFQAGGPFGFRYVKIIYATNTENKSSIIEMIEIVD